MLLAVSGASAQTIVLDDFSDGVKAKKNASKGGDFTTWYDSTVKSTGDPSAFNSPTSEVMKIDRGDGENGIYRIFQVPISGGGSYHINGTVKVIEFPGELNAIRNYQIGVIVNGMHRQPGNTRIPAASIFAEPPAGYFTPGDDSAKPTQKLRTQNFMLNPGDTVLISLGTDVTSGDFDENSGRWKKDSYILIDDLVLEPASLPVSLSAFTLE